MKERVKIFDGYRAADLENEINEFLDIKMDGKLRDIRFSSFGVTQEGESESFSALIIYTLDYDD